MSNTKVKSPLRRRITPSVPFILHVEDAEGTFDQSFLLAYDLNSMALFEEATGLNLFRDIAKILAERSVRIVTALFWAGIQINHAADYGGEEGLRLVRSNVTLPQFNPIMEACMQAFMGQLPKETQDNLKKQAAEREAAANGGEEGAEEATPLAQGEAAPATK